MQEDGFTAKIFEGALQLHESLNVTEVATNAVELMLRLVSADSWAVFLSSERFERLELVHAANPMRLELSSCVELGAYDPLARAARERRLVVAQPHNGGAQDEPMSVLCAPLVVGERLVGSMQAVRRGLLALTSAEAFDAREARVIERLCPAVARALANALDYQEAVRLALVDDLTRLYNVRYLYKALEREIRRARRYGSALSVVFMDLDGFKLVNDAYGHRVGSVTLTEVARVISSSVRESDFVARYGGDEFVMMLPETPAKSAMQMAERVRSQIAAHMFDGGVGAMIALTASFGVASFPENATDAEKLIELADQAMYQAKQHEKNSVKLANS